MQKREMSLRFNCNFFIFVFFGIFLFISKVLGQEHFLPIPLINRESKLLDITTKDLKVLSNASLIAADFKDGIRWERSKENILMPFVKVRFQARDNGNANLHYRYDGVTYLPQSVGGIFFTDINVSIFDNQKILVFHEGVQDGEIRVELISSTFKDKTVLMDYSCSGFNLKVHGIDRSFMSIGCQFIKEMSDGKIVPTLRVNWISNEYRTLDSFNGPYSVTFSEGREARFQVKNDQGKRKEIRLQVSFPKSLNRLKTSVGLGPYFYNSKHRDVHVNSQLLPSLMFYGNYFLNNIHSLKFFEAVIMKESVFNHTGLYLGSELGKFYDDRLIISSLVGLQALSFRSKGGSDGLFTQIIYPQGAEIVMHHPFGLENYRFALGGFLSPQKDVIYRNFWTRFGSKVFVEFNYIDWEYGERSASMYGISVGFPLAQFF
jgi:hypothetical protein